MSQWGQFAPLWAQTFHPYQCVTKDESTTNNLDVCAEPITLEMSVGVFVELELWLVSLGVKHDHATLGAEFFVLLLSDILRQVGQVDLCRGARVSLKPTCRSNMGDNFGLESNFCTSWAYWNGKNILFRSANIIRLNKT